MELSPAEALALAKFDARPFRDQVAPGVEPVDFRVRVAGTVTVGPDSEQLFVTVADYQQLLAQTLLRLKRPRLDELVRQACRSPRDTEGLAAQVRDLVGRHKPKTICRGRVTGDLSFTRLAR